MPPLDGDWGIKTETTEDKQFAAIIYLARAIDAL